jgi:hypothetical protein
VGSAIWPDLLPGINIPGAFLLGFFLMVAPAIVTHLLTPLFIAIMAMLGLLDVDKSRVGGLVEYANAELPLDQERLNKALDDLRQFADSYPSWLDESLRQWQTAESIADKNRLRYALLDRLYAEASKPGDYAQRRALNEVRLVINPWVDNR